MPLAKPATGRGNCGVLRFARSDERSAWDALVAAHHHLGLRSLFGKSLRYVATIEGRWLALLGWQAAALKCAARDGPDAH